MIRVHHRLRFTMQHVFGHSENLGNECADHAAALDTYGLISGHNVTSRRVGFGTLSTLMVVSMGATVSVKLLNDFSTFGQTLLLFIRTEFRIGNLHRVLYVQCVPHVCSCHGSHLLSAFCCCFRWFNVFPTSDGSNFFIRVYCIEH